MKRLIVLEGIDCSGKSTLAKMLAEKLGYKFDHEPTFSSETADRLNFSSMDCWRREFYFMKDRMKHQSVLNSADTVLDRYILSGLAYAEVFSSEVVPMMKSIYSLADEFKEPDLVVFVDMDPVNAAALNTSRRGSDEYNDEFTIAKAQDIRNSFLTHLDTMREWEVPFCRVTPYFGDIDRTFNEVIIMAKKFLPELEEMSEQASGRES